MSLKPFLCLRRQRKCPWSLFYACADSANTPEVFFAFAPAAQIHRKSFLHLRRQRKCPGSPFYVCADSANVTEVLFTFAPAAQIHRKSFLHLRRQRKRPAPSGDWGSFSHKPICQRALFFLFIYFHHVHTWVYFRLSRLAIPAQAGNSVRRSQSRVKAYGLLWDSRLRGNDRFCDSAATIWNAFHKRAIYKMHRIRNSDFFCHECTNYY